MYVSHDNALT